MPDWRLSGNLEDLSSFRVQADVARIAVEMHSSYITQGPFTESRDVVGSL